MPRHLTAQEKALVDRELAHREMSPMLRLVLTIFAQGIGLVLLFVLGLGTFPSGQDNIERGFKFIQKIGWWYLGLSIAIPLVPLVIMGLLKRKLFQHGYTDFVLLTYVAVDLVLLLLLVSQEGGLCRSMFLPVFFIIPIAYIIAERPAHRLRKFIVLVSIMICIHIAYKVSTMFMPPGGTNLQPAEGTLSILKWSMTITDFSTLAHSSYDEAVYYASMISASIPIIQLLLVVLRDRIREQDDEEAETPPQTLMDGVD